MAEEKVVQTVNIQQEENTAPKSHMSGPFIDRRFVVYERVKMSVKTLDILIAVCTLLLIVALILGVYKR
jgi:hypothetical protein